MCCGFAKQVLLRALALCFDEIFVSGEREQHVQPSAELTAIGMKRKASALKTAKATTTRKVGYPIAKKRLFGKPIYRSVQPITTRGIPPIKAAHRNWTSHIGMRSNVVSLIATGRYVCIS